MRSRVWTAGWRRLWCEGHVAQRARGLGATHVKGKGSHACHAHLSLPRLPYTPVRALLWELLCFLGQHLH